MVKLGSLFDGIGGWQLAAIRAGITPTDQRNQLDRMIINANEHKRIVEVENAIKQI